MDRSETASTPGAPPPATLSDLEERASRRGPAFGESAHILCDNLVRIYKTEGVEVVALQGLDLLIDKGELVAIVGASGSGKSTLLNVLSGLDVPTAGVARVAGVDLLSMTAKDRLRYRRETVGFIWQQTARNLLPYLTAAENVALPVRLAGRGAKAGRARAAELLDLLGVAYCAGRRPGEMSGGEQQRVAIAVALANGPEVILADEPTGELDTDTSEDVFAPLRTANRELGVTAVIVTHDDLVSEQVDRTVGIRDGRTSSETLRRESEDGGIIAQEYAVLDRVGRLQLPRDFMNALKMERRVRLELERDHIGVWPEETRDTEGTDSDA
ncbi:ABC-type lipoprotein export system ATPase subunit [Thermocatellispora tengchongensis]|uniref:ABC-type lipoprotein export system ATPase subunit n=1 Tax=Thermocatellispora tengchongensis TaxID=1073253 RepID=A0A840PAQ1_9ACTN|nr:ABC transporter ATP-binding protein [Thermocatellispora tengchongensis]MBB5133075.1 ABC-type lipoprotein export system ATPase subunit [Thermocatellispora tengchongensis]